MLMIGMISGLAVAKITSLALGIIAGLAAIIGAIVNRCLPEKEMLYVDTALGAISCVSTQFRTKELFPITLAAVIGRLAAEIML